MKAFLIIMMVLAMFGFCAFLFAGESWSTDTSSGVVLNITSYTSQDIKDKLALLKVVDQEKADQVAILTKKLAELNAILLANQQLENILNQMLSQLPVVP